MSTTTTQPTEDRAIRTSTVRITETVVYEVPVTHRPTATDEVLEERGLGKLLSTHDRNRFFLHVLERDVELDRK